MQFAPSWFRQHRAPALAGSPSEGLGRPEWMDKQPLATGDLLTIIGAIVSAVLAQGVSDWQGKVGICALLVILSCFWLYLRSQRSGS